MPMTAEVERPEQLEMEVLPETEFGKSCKKYLSIANKIKDAKEDLNEAAKEVKGFLDQKHKDCVRYGGMEFYIPEQEEPTVKCRPVKGKPEAYKKAA